jgi:hypothetical protein
MAFVNAGGMPSLTKGQFDNQMNGIIQALDGAFNQVQQLEAFLAAHPDADFTAAAGGPGPTGYAAGDVTNFKSAFSDLDQLRTIYQGSANLGTAKDFRTFAKLIATLVH